MSQQDRSVASFYRYLQDRCYAGSASASSTQRPQRLVNDTLTNYIMDNLSAYVYPNLLFALLVQTDAGRGNALVSNDYRTLGHRVELRALQRASVDLDLQIRQAEQSNDEAMVRSLRRARKLAADRSGRLGLAKDGYPHLTLLLEQTDLLNRHSVAREHREREQTFIEQWRASLLVHIQSMCAVIDDFEIVKGTGEPRSREREQFANDEWSEACYRQNLRKDKLGVLYGIGDLDVFRGEGRLVRRDDDGVTLDRGKTWDYKFITNLFLAFPDCFTFERANASSREQARNLYNDPLGRSRGELVVVTLDKPHLVRRTNRVLRPGIYRLDRTNFLLTKGAKRSVAVRSNYCEGDGTLRFAETHYARPNFDGQAPIVRTYHAGTANLFFAVSRKASVRGLLGFWVGALIRNTQIDNVGTEIMHNRATSALSKCCVRHQNEAYNRIVHQSVPARADMPSHVRVILQAGDGSTRSATDASQSVLYNGLMVEYLCAAQPSSLCPPRKGQAKAPFNKHQSVGAFLFLYALVYYSKYSLKSLTLFARAWQYVVNKTKHDVVSGSIANYYNANFGLSFVPAKLPNERLDSKQAVSKRIQEEIGWTYMKRRYADAFANKWRLVDLLNTHSEFCNFFTLLKAVEDDDDKLVDLNRVTDLPLFASNYYFVSPAALEQREGGVDEKILSDGFMFRHYPHLAELEMRAVSLYLDVLESRQRKGTGDTDLWKREARRYRAPSSSSKATRYTPQRTAVEELVANKKIGQDLLEQRIIEPDRERQMQSSRNDSVDESGAACSFDQRRETLRNEAAQKIQMATQKQREHLRELALFASAERVQDDLDDESQAEDDEADDVDIMDDDNMQEDASEHRDMAQDDDAGEVDDNDLDDGDEKADDDDDDEDEPTYVVESIVGHRKVGQVREYKVRWVGYSAKDDTFEPLENLWNAVDFIYDYHQRKGLVPDRAAKEAFASFCRDWSGWKWSKNSCAHDSVLVAMLAPEPSNPLRDELTSDLADDSAQTKRTRSELRRAWRDIRHPAPSDTCWSLRMALAAEFPQQREMLVGGRFVVASSVIDLLFEHFVQPRPFWCTVNSASAGRPASAVANVDRPMVPLSKSGDVEPLVRQFFGPRTRRIEGKESRYQFVLLDNDENPLQYLWISKQVGQSALANTLRVDTVKECDQAAIDGERHAVDLQLSALIAAQPNHFVCAFRCLNRWYHYDDSPGSDEPIIEAIGTFDDLVTYKRGLYSKKTEHLYYVRAANA